MITVQELPMFPLTMSPLIWKGGAPWAPVKAPAPLAACALLLLLPTASCVPSLSAAPLVATASAAANDDATNPEMLALLTPATEAIASFTAPPAQDLGAPADPLAPPAVPLADAPAVNASIAFASDPNPAAPAFVLRAGDTETQARSLRCLTDAVYYEAASESDDGQRAVAQVVLNRMRHPAYPATVCGVVYQNADRWLACQFSFACDGARARVPSVAGWARARAIAAQALAGRTYAPVGLATHYHTKNVVPFWAHKLAKNAVVGAHIFYRLNDALGRAGAFRQRYAGFEPFPAPVRFGPPTRVAATEALVEAPAAVVATPVVAPVAIALADVPAPKPASHRAAPPDETPPVAAPSPIMRAVEASTIRDEYLNSGAVRPEYAPGR